MKNNSKDNILKLYTIFAVSFHVRILKSAPGWFGLILGLILPFGLSAQLELTVNGTAEFGLSKAGKDSHFFYNGINREYTDWRVGIKELNAMIGLHYRKQWSLNSRFFWGREEDARLERFDLPLLNIQWKNKNGKYGLQLGRFINPFGQYNDRQLPHDRTFVALPITHVFSTRISNIFGGWYEDLPQPLPSRPRGWPLHYYGGYQTGLRFDWIINPDKWSLALALTSGAAFAPDQLKDPLKLGINARLEWQPSWFWKQGFSVSGGNILKRTEMNKELTNLNKYNQWMVGTDITSGFGFWEFRGEMMAAWHNIPFYDRFTKTFVRDKNNEISEGTLFQMSGYVEAKVEPPFLPGAYLAGQVGGIYFGDSSFSAFDTNQWDGHAVNLMAGAGYKITPWLLFRTTYSWLSTGDQWSWQNALAFHF